MKPAPAPLIIEKDGFRLIFNEPMERGCITLECGNGGLSFFLDDIELEKLSRATWKAARRIRDNREISVAARTFSSPEQSDR